MASSLKSISASILSFAFVLGCGGDKEDSKACKELAAEVATQETIQKEIKVALKAAVDEALANPPVGGTEDCDATGLNWQKYTHLTPEILERGHLGDPFYLGELKPGSRCASTNSELIKQNLASLRSQVESTSKGYRLFFVDQERVESKHLGDKKYSPGSVKGRLLVWSEADRKFVCTAEGRAESGKRILTTSGGMKSNKDLNKHLTRNAVGAGIKILKKIDPAAKASPPATASHDAGPSDSETP